MNGAVIEISDLTKFYGKARGIEHVNLSIGAGEIFGFIGPNGAGKSTTIRILMNMIFPTSGNATILGHDVVRETKKIKGRTGYIPSDANAYTAMTVIEFLRYFARYYDLDDGEARIKRLSDPFELDLKRKIADLSTGNRKKVAIVQSLLHRPDVLICDEPTTGLDPLMQSVFFDLLRTENNRGMTIFFSSHVLAEVQMLCRKVAVIKEGRILKVEEIETLRRKQLKRIRIEFPDRDTLERFSIEGSVDADKGPGNEIMFMFSGDINELIRKLAGIVIVNFTIEEPSLEEIFMHYYMI